VRLISSRVSRISFTIANGRSELPALAVTE
jgi:hypothetical protein